MVRILFLSDDREDYLADSILHGLISMGKHTIVDYPKKEILYKGSFSNSTKKNIYGHGFTLYGLLPDRKIDRTLIWKRLESDWFDIVIVANIWRQFGLLAQLSKLRLSTRTKLAILDGDDDARIYPFSSTRLKEHGLRPSDLKLSGSQYDNYFKRELDDTKPQSWVELIVPTQLRIRIRRYLQLESLKPQQCSFSIPKEWIRNPKPDKKQYLFPSHIVDSEVRELFAHGQSSYAFENQEKYFDDLALARFGITTKRAGWDCLRHYEIAAAGSVPCFRELLQKPEGSAPHGLNEANCLIYENAKDLQFQVNSMNKKRYKKLLQGSHQWVRTKTTIHSANDILKSITL